MSKIIEKIDLESYSIEELSVLIEMIKKEIDQRGQERLQRIRIQMERLANGVGMTAREIFSSPETMDSDANRKEIKKIKFRNPADPQQTWSGRGKRPRWLQDALDKGVSLDDFAA